MGQQHDSAANIQDNSPSKSRNNEQEHHSSPIKTGNRAAGLIILLIMFGIFWIYGWASEIKLVDKSNQVTTSTQTIFGNFFILSAIFTVIGFGLLLTFYKTATGSAVFTSLFIVSLTVLISPILQKFWFNVFINDFHGTAITNMTDTVRLIKASHGSLEVNIDFYNLKIALANAISQLVLMLGAYGRLSPPQIIIGSLLFNFSWNLCHFLCILLAWTGPDPRLFDDYQITSVYLFAASFGLIMSQLLKKPAIGVFFSQSKTSAILSQVGTFFLFLSFCTTTTFFSLKQQGYEEKKIIYQISRTYIWQQAFIGTFFALSASVISTYLFTVLLSDEGKFGSRQSIIGTITGAIMFGPVAGTCTNIGAAIACGLFAGFLSAGFYHKIFPKLNQNGIFDAFGLTLILAVSFLGTFVVSPIVIRTYYNYNVVLPTLASSNSLSGNIITNVDAAGWSLVFVGIALGLGLACGTVVGLLLKCLERAENRYFDDGVFFLPKYGLRDLQKGSAADVAHTSTELARN